MLLTEAEWSGMKWLAQGHAANGWMWEQTGQTEGRARMTFRDLPRPCSPGEALTWYFGLILG